VLRLRSSSIVMMTRSRPRPVVTSPPLTFLLLARCNDLLSRRTSFREPCLLRALERAHPMPNRFACKACSTTLPARNALQFVCTSVVFCPAPACVPTKADSSRSDLSRGDRGPKRRRGSVVSSRSAVLMQSCAATSPLGCALIP
jgi:hypothetical protein